MSVEIVTFGCRLNTAESETARAHARAAGLTDTVVVNTCAVTAEAVAQARQTVRRLRRERPGARIVVTGCAAQLDPEAFAAIEGVDGVLGNAEKLRADAWASLDGTPRVAVGDIMTERGSGDAAAPQPGATRAIVPVQNGCDHRCTFCVIPFGRGPSRSVPIADAVAQVRRMVENGHREAVLTGVDLTSYRPGLGLLVRAILRGVPELARLRLSSIDQVEVDADLFAALAEEPRLMPHLHLSLQSGDDLILKRMKRRHSRADAVAFCERVRRLRPDVVFGADAIAGFPTETEAMFARTLGLIDDCGLTHLHVFPYSQRPGTPAARMPQVPRPVVVERARRLRERGHAALRRHLEGEVGARRTVLTESGGIGRTAQFTAVRLAAPVAPNLLLDVAIAGHDGRRLLAQA